MKTHEILLNIIENLKADKFAEAQEDCYLLPTCAQKDKLYATIGAIDSQTEQAYRGTKSAAIALADKLIGHI
jgi:hypothetical protein